MVTLGAHTTSLDPPIAMGGDFRLAARQSTAVSVLALSCPARCCELPSLVRNRGGAATILHTVSRRFVAYGSDKDGAYPCRGRLSEGPISILFVPVELEAEWWS